MEKEEEMNKTEATKPQAPVSSAPSPVPSPTNPNLTPPVMATAPQPPVQPTHVPPQVNETKNTFVPTGANGVTDDQFFDDFFGDD